MNMKTKLLILGSGGHGRVAADTARRMGYSDIAFLDDAVQGSVGRYKVVGKMEAIAEYRKDADFFVAIGNAAVRKTFFEKLKASGARVVSLIHPAAVIGEEVAVGDGTIVMAGAVVQTGAALGNGVIVNTCASVDHDCTVGDFTHVSVGAHVAGTVHIGAMTMLGAGSTVINNVDVADNVTVGAGAVVVGTIEEAGVYVGVPARKK